MYGDKSPILIHTHFEKLVNGNEIRICATPRIHAYIFRLLNCEEAGDTNKDGFGYRLLHSKSQGTISNHLLF